MPVLGFGTVEERMPSAHAQALLEADRACAALGLQFELKCAACGVAWGSERTRVRGGQVAHYEIVCECKRRVYDAIVF